MRQTVGILGTPVDALDTSEVLARLEQFIQERRFHQVATANTDFLINAMLDPELRDILRTADLVMPDGMPVVWAARLMGNPLPERVTGADIVPVLAAQAARKGYRIYMLGGREDVAPRAKANLEAHYPGIQIVGCASPPVCLLTEMESDKLLEDIASVAPDILLVAFGNPKQEKWINMHRERLRNVPVCIGVGGTFDFLAGETSRAPHWMQRAGLEWSHRLIQEPRRLWRRYVRDIGHFSSSFLKQLWPMRFARRGTKAWLQPNRMKDCTVISVVGSLDQRVLAEFQCLSDRALNLPTHLVLDLHRATHIDSAALGTLLNLPKRASYVNREVRITGLNQKIRSVLYVAHLEEIVRIYPTLADALQGDKSERLDIRLKLGVCEAVLILQGRADHSSMPDVVAKLNEIPTTVHYIDLDLRGLLYIDSSMLTILRRFAENHRQQPVRLVPSKAVKRTLRREKLDRYFELVEAPRQISTASVEAHVSCIGRTGIDTV